MIKINKVTTKSGDKGITLGPKSLHISKGSNEIEFLGVIDELNVIIGEASFYSNDLDIKDILFKIQNQLFDLGYSFYKNEDFTKNYVIFIENAIEKFNKNLPELNSFLIPSGKLNILKYHSARVSARRAERIFWKLKLKNIINIGIYLNRLSDLFFIILRKESNVMWEIKKYL